MATNCAADSNIAAPFDSEPGQALLRLAAPALEERVRRFHGDTMLWCGVDPAYERLADRCMVRHRFRMRSDAGRANETPVTERNVDDAAAEFRGCLSQIPVRSKAFDGVVLHHVLDTTSDPRSAIREVARVVVPGGSLLISAMNPISLTGVHGGITRMRPLRRDPGRLGRFVPPWRLVDWLSVLGFTLDRPVAYVAYRPPWAHRFFEKHASPAIRDWLHRSALPFGGVYVIEARKQAVGMRPLWRKDRVDAADLAPVAYPKISARSRS